MIDAGRGSILCGDDNLELGFAFRSALADRLNDDKVFGSVEQTVTSVLNSEASTFWEWVYCPLVVPQLTKNCVASVSDSG